MIVIGKSLEGDPSSILFKENKLYLYEQKQTNQLTNKQTKEGGQASEHATYKVQELSFLGDREKIQSYTRTL